MKDRETTSVAEPPSPYPQFLTPQHLGQQPQHRFVRRQRTDDDLQAWRELPARGAEINLLANSLTSRLRRLGAARQKALTNSVVQQAASRLAAEYSDYDTDDDGGETKEEKTSRKGSQPVIRPSILKRNLNDAVDTYRYSPDESLKSSSFVSDHYLPNVFRDSRLSNSTGQLDKVGVRTENGKQYTGKQSWSNGVRGGGGGVSQSRGFASSGPVRLVKRAGIFQPADKYAQGRQTLHGDDLPHGKHVPVDYETVTLPSRAGTPDSDSVGGWSSGKSKKKGLKVSWKSPSVSDQHLDPPEARTEDTVSPVRQRSATTPQSEATGFSFVKPRFIPGKSRVQSIGVRWKVSVPNVKRGPRVAVSAGDNSSSGDGEGPKTVHINDISGHSSPSTEHTLPPAPHSLTTQKPPSLKSCPARDSHHPWRALYPRDVHPVTTAMEREGTSVSKTMWHVPTRKVHAHTYMEDLQEADIHQWRPPKYYRLRGQPLGASSPNQSMQVRTRGGPSTVDTVLQLSNGADTATQDNEQEDSCRSY